MTGEALPPLISVVMPVWNGEPLVRAALDSILSQTFTNFECLVINDGSTDGTRAVLESIRDPRLRVVNRGHRGLVSSLNEGIALARGRYIARMDADDFSKPERFELQAAFLDRHPDVAIVGTGYEIVNPSGRLLEICQLPLRDADIRRALFFETPFGHGTVMMRRQAVLDAGGYRDTSWPVEDYDLWRRMVSHGRAANLPHVLYRHLVNPDGICARQPELQSQRYREVLAEVRTSVPFIRYNWRRVVEGARFYGDVDASRGTRLRRRFLQDQYVLSMLEARSGGPVRVLLNVFAALALDPMLSCSMAFRGFLPVRQVAGRMRGAPAIPTQKHLG